MSGIGQFLPTVLVFPIPAAPVALRFQNHGRHPGGCDQCPPRGGHSSASDGPFEQRRPLGPFRQTLCGAESIRSQLPALASYQQNLQEMRRSGQSERGVHDNRVHLGKSWRVLWLLATRAKRRRGTSRPIQAWRRIQPSESMSKLGQPSGPGWGSSSSAQRRLNRQDRSRGNR